MDKLIDYICDELAEYEKKAEKGKLSMAEMQYVDLLAHTKKNLLKGEEMMDGESYMYDDGYSRERDGNRGNRYMYARGRGRNARRDSRGRYSSEGRYMMDAGDMVDQLRDMMDDAPDERTKMEFKRFIQKMEQM
jgi:hypothetical protein